MSKELVYSSSFIRCLSSIIKIIEFIINLKEKNIKLGTTSTGKLRNFPSFTFSISLKYLFIFLLLLNFPTQISFIQFINFNKLQNNIYICLINQCKINMTMLSNSFLLVILELAKLVSLADLFQESSILNINLQ